MSDTNHKNPFAKVPDDAIVKDEKPLETCITPEEVESKDEVEYERMKSANHDMDGDDTPDLDISPDCAIGKSREGP